VAASSVDDYFGLLLGPFGQTVTRGFGEWLWNSAIAMPNLYGDTLLPAMSSTPLRSALESHVNLDALRAPGAPEVYITLTNVRTGLPRVVGNANLTLDAILASACLPELFRAVEIGEHAFWDGGFTGNPALWPLIRQPKPGDILLVQLSPTITPELPASAAAVRERMSEIVFHSSLVTEMQAIQAVREVMSNRGQAGMRSDPVLTEAEVFRQSRFHRVGPPSSELLVIGASGDRSSRNLQALWEAGRSDARRFLARDGKQIGLKETLDIKAAFIDGYRAPAVGSTIAVEAPGSAQPQPLTPVRSRRIAPPSDLSIGGS
jgi:NTE family protein